jgi:hypothetical protein
MDADVLNSWKEIAAYIGRGVRTVQRWEQDLGFPVRRPRGKHRSAVIAIKQEINAWLRAPHAHPGSPANHVNGAEYHAKLLHNTELLHLRTKILLAHSDTLRKQVARAVDIGSLLRTSCVHGKTEKKNWAGLTTPAKNEVIPAVELGAAPQAAPSGRNGKLNGKMNGKIQTR